MSPVVVGDRSIILLYTTCPSTYNLQNIQHHLYYNTSSHFSPASWWLDLVVNEAEILLKVVLNTINSNPIPKGCYKYHIKEDLRTILGGCRGHDHMVVGFTTTYANSANHHWCCEFESRSGRGVQHYVIKFVSDLRQVSGFLRVLWFPPPIKLTATK
jgi:hypothetical protein